MTPREIVLGTIRFEGPERIAMGLPHPYPNDFARAGISADPDWKPGRTFSPTSGAMWEDEWGNVWARLDNFSKGEVVEGAIKDWSQLDDYRMPTYDDPARYQQARAAFAGQGDRFKIGGLPGFPFAIMRYLRRMDVFLADLLLHPSEVRRLADRVTALLARCIANWADAGADAVMFAEDWGTQDRLLISPAMWREVFKPDFRILCSAARRRNLTVWMHSCGYIFDIVNDLIECGVSVLQLDQPGLFGVDRLAGEFGGRVTFWCPVDIQRVLPTGDAQLIESFARDMVAKLGARGGGFIAGYYGGNDAIGVRPEWQDIACQAFVKYAGHHSPQAPARSP
jgi:uroporphyrinogen decarboxylase